MLINNKIAIKIKNIVGKSTVNLYNRYNYILWLLLNYYFY